MYFFLQCLNLNEKCPPQSNFPDSALTFLILRESGVGDVFFPSKELQNLEKTFLLKQKKGKRVVGGKLSFVFHIFSLSLIKLSIPSIRDHVFTLVRS